MRESLLSSSKRRQALRARLSVRAELMLAGLPTATVLVVFAFVEAVTEQRLLFASLASSAFLIYLDPEHGTNSVRTLAISQLLAAAIGFVAYEAAGGTYAGAAVAMVAGITLMILLDVVHPPAVATVLAFALRTGDERNLLLFGITVALVALLITLEKITLHLLTRLRRQQERSGTE